MSWMTKRTVWIQAAVLLLVLGATDSPVRTQGLDGLLPPQQAPRLDKLDPLLQIAQANPLGRSRIIVRATGSQMFGLLATLIQQLGGVLGRQLSIIDAQAADVPNTALITLAASNAVLRIAVDRATVGTLELTGAVIGAT